MSLKSVEFLIEQEVRRPRGSGLTTALYELSKKFGAKFVVHNEVFAKRFNDKNVITIERDIRGMDGSFVFDHMAIYHAGARALNEIDNLNKKNRELSAAHDSAMAAKDARIAALERDKAGLVEAANAVAVFYDDEWINQKFGTRDNPFTRLKEALRTHKGGEG